MGSCAAMNDPPFICPLTLQLLWFIPVLYTSSLATNGASRSWARFWLFIGVWVFWCLLEQNDSSAFWERLPKMSYTTSVVCSCCSDAPKLQGQKLRRALGGGSNTTGGSPLQPLMDPLSFTTGQRGPSPGEVFQLPSNPFLLPKLSQKTLGLTLADLFLFRHLGDSAWEGFCSFIRKHEIRALIFLFSVRCWKQDLKCQNNQVKNRDPKCVTHLRY